MCKLGDGQEAPQVITITEPLEVTCEHIQPWVKKPLLDLLSTGWVVVRTEASPLAFKLGKWPFCRQGTRLILNLGQGMVSVIY